MKTDLVQADTTLKTVPAEAASELPPAQIAALDALLSGKTATDVTPRRALAGARSPTG